MSIVDIVLKMPAWYLMLTILFSFYYAFRGIMEQGFINTESPFNQFQKIFYYYIQEFLFKVIMTASGFISLFIANYIVSTLKSFDNIGAGTAILIIFLIVWGITGISGYLTFLIVSGRFPSIK